MKDIKLVTLCNIAKIPLVGTSAISIAHAYFDNGIASVNTKNVWGKKAFVAHNCYSISKSVVGLGLGSLFDKGLIKPTDKLSKFLAKYYPENYDRKWDEVTLNDVFHHSTGADSAVDFDITDAGKWQDKEWLHTLLGYKIKHKIGKDWKYSDGNYYILARVFEEVAGEDVYEYLNKHLFIPLDFYYSMWAKDSLGHILGGTGLYLRTEDLAKLGLLWLGKGVYNGKRYISEEWIDLALAPSDVNFQSNYGYGVRKYSDNIYTISGMYGQNIFIDYNKNQVFAWHAKSGTILNEVCKIL